MPVLARPGIPLPGRHRGLRLRPPGILSLGALVVGSFELVEADFQRFYALDLPSALWGPAPISGRRLRALLKGLPAEGALARSLGTPQPGDWTTTDELLATLAEITHAHAGLFITANSKKGAQKPKPLRIPRPAQRGAQTERQTATPEEMRAFFGSSIRYETKGKG